jgi:putative LysE/RhtB family amino acid efflux pump
MFFILFAKAFFLGIIVTAPVGPVGALVINRTLKVGMALGVATGIGAAFADATFAFLAIFGVSQIQDFLDKNDFYIALAGGVILVLLGSVYMLIDLRHKKVQLKDMVERADDWLEAERKLLKARHRGISHYLRAAMGSLIITFSNPVTIVGFAGAFAAFALLGDEEVTYLTHCIIVGGVFLGALSWWLFLASIIKWMRTRLSNSSILNIQLSTHALIILSGALCLFRAWMRT